MNPLNPTFELEFIEAEAAVCGARVIVGGGLWCVVLGLLDRVAFRSDDPYILNLRLGLWLLLAEILVATSQVRYTAPASFPLVKRTAFIISEILTHSRDLVLYIAINVVIRWLVITVLTAAALWLFGASWLSVIAAVAPSIAFTSGWLSGIAKVGVPPVVRGTHLGSYIEAIAKAAMMAIMGKRVIADRMAEQGLQEISLEDVQLATIPFGGVDHPLFGLDPHTLILATTGAGKTMILRMMLNAYLMRFSQRRNRAIINDAKREYAPLLTGMGVPLEDIVFLNPSDARCTAWNIAGDIRTKDDAVNITNAMVPEDQRDTDNRFFLVAVRSIATEVKMCLHSLMPGEWRLIDEINAMRTLGVLKRVLATTREGREVYERYFGQDASEQIAGIMATLDARFISQFETIARVWSRCAQSITLTDWVTSNRILLLGYDENNAGVDRINQAVFERAARLLCALPDDPEGKADLSIIGLDEPAFLIKMPMLMDLISLGRTKGVRVLFAPQDLDGLYEKYGEHQTNAILALCGNIAAMRMVSPKTRKWASELFGEYEAWESDFSESDTVSHGSSGSSTSHSTSTSTRRVKRESILPSEFFNLPKTDRSNGMHGFFATPSMGAWRAAILPDWIAAHLTPKDPETPGFVKRPDFMVDPVYWTASEEQRFGTGKMNGNQAAGGHGSGPNRTPKPKTPQDANDAVKKKRPPQSELPDW